MTTKTYIVALHKDVDYNQFWTEIEGTTTGVPHVPDRAVSIANNRDAFRRICEYDLTDAEAEQLLNDPRVAGVEIPVRNNPNVKIVSNTIQAGNFSKTTASNGDNINWGLVRHNNKTNVYGTGLTEGSDYNYILDGTGVDVVISDTGIQADHPEFQDANGVSRVSRINWEEYYPNANNNLTNWSYTDTNGHGTHVAGIVAGKTYGWAKNANIISLFYSTESHPDEDLHLEPLDTFEALINWHVNKNGSRPTVVNISWVLAREPSSTVNGYRYDISSGQYRGNNWTAPYGDWEYTTHIARGLIAPSNYPLPLQSGLYSGYHSTAYNAALGELIDAGMIITKAAGNQGFKIDVEGGPDYNNSFRWSTLSWLWGDVYYHRGASPTHPDAIVVGALGRNFYPSNIAQGKSATQDYPANYSQKGPGVDIYAAGTRIMSATSTINTLADNGLGTPSPYHLDSSFKQVNVSGTSQASPQVAGMVALYLQQNPTATPAQVKAWLIENSTNTMYSSTATDVNDHYTDDQSLLGGEPRVAYMSIKGLGKVKDESGEWKQLTTVHTKTSNGWEPLKAVHIKTEEGWVQVF